MQILEKVCLCNQDILIYFIFLITPSRLRSVRSYLVIHYLVCVSWSPRVGVLPFCGGTTIAIRARRFGGYGFSLISASVFFNALLIMLLRMSIIALHLYYQTSSFFPWESFQMVMVTSQSALLTASTNLKHKIMLTT